MKLSGDRTKWYRIETSAHAYLIPKITQVIQELLKLPPEVQILDAGCGAGRLVHCLYKLGFKNVYGFDISSSGIELAKRNFPEIAENFFIHDAYESELPPNFPKEFDLVISMEVIEHLYDPRSYLDNVNHWLKDNGYLILTTPYHGYLKNLAIAFLNKFDKHFHPLEEGGHIKFFSH